MVKSGLSASLDRTHGESRGGVMVLKPEYFPNIIRAGLAGKVNLREDAITIRTYYSISTERVGGSL
jgi:hypothetical protein